MIKNNSNLSIKNEDEPEFPAVFPPVLREMAHAAAKAINCNLPFLLSTMLITGSVAVGAKVRIQIKKGWMEGACLYLVLIADPGSKKSPSIKAAINPLEDLQKKFAIKVKEMRENPENEGDSLKLRTLLTTDATMEALMELLQQNPHGLLNYRDEYIGLIKAMNQYKAGGDDFEKYLSLWSQSMIVIHRKGKEPIQVEYPLVSIVGGIQPEVLLSLSNMKDNGFFERHLFCYPKPIPLLHTEEDIPDELAKKYRDLIQGIYISQSECELRVINFSQYAQTLWNNWHTSYCEEMNASNFKGALSKLEGYTARFALILEFLWSASENKPVKEVSVRSLEGAILLNQYFVANIKKVYESFITTKIDKQIEKAVLWFKKQKNGMATMRKFYTNRVAGVQNANEAFDILMEMRSRNLGRIEETNDGLSSKRPNYLFCLRIDLLDTNPQNPQSNGK